MMTHPGEFPELVDQVQRMNSTAFEVNYLKLQDISEQRINQNMISDYIKNKFKWNKVKTQYFLHKNSINSVQDLLTYQMYPRW